MPVPWDRISGVDDCGLEDQNFRAGERRCPELILRVASSQLTSSNEASSFPRLKLFKLLRRLLLSGRAASWPLYRYLRVRFPYGNRTMVFLIHVRGFRRP